VQECAIDDVHLGLKGDPRTWRCRQARKHGPHLHMSIRGGDGKTSGYYAPGYLAREVRAA